MRYYTVKEASAMTGYTDQHIIKNFIKKGVWEAHQMIPNKGKIGHRGSRWMIPEIEIPAYARQVPNKSVTKLKILK